MVKLLWQDKGLLNSKDKVLKDIKVTYKRTDFHTQTGETRMSGCERTPEHK
jgi:hypothetical protein